MTLYDICAAWYDDTNTFRPPLSAGQAALVADLIAYADGAYNKSLSRIQAIKVVDCIIDFEKACNGELSGFDAGQWPFNWDVLVKFLLQDIEI